MHAVVDRTIKLFGAEVVKFEETYKPVIEDAINNKLKKVSFVNEWIINPKVKIKLTNIKKLIKLEVLTKPIK